MNPDAASPSDAVPATLLPQHQALVEGSAIHPDVARERGYRSVTKKADLGRLGFSMPQRRTPALLIPVRNVHGEIATYQIRPDEPRIDARGKSVKYETPAGSRMVLDVPARCRVFGWLGDPKRLLLVTEGARKADAAVSRELCTVALLGVWNWRGSNEHDGTVALPDWESIALRSRDVCICFDSDVVTKPAVHAALRRLKRFLEGRGASVRVIYLPPGAGGQKVGLDDYFAAGGTVEGLTQLATDHLRESDEPAPKPLYATTPDGRTIFLKDTREGVIEETLANFKATIVEEIVEDDGVESSGLYRIDAVRGGRVQSVTVSVSAFSQMNWPSELLGAKAIVSPGFGSRDRLRAAIQTLSPEPVPTRRVYRHLGWVETDHGHVYLHAEGAIGAKGPVAGVSVRMDPPLNRYVLPAPPEGDELVAATRQSLAFLDGLAPDHVVFPMFSIPWICTVDQPEGSVHATGKTGVGKTELAALIQRHHGASMDAQHLPGSWSSTANANEAIGFYAKDSTFTIDDYNPVGSAADVQRQAREADRVLRAQANGSARGRLRSDTSPRPPKSPRCMFLSTGEDVPPGHSLCARMLVVEVGVGDVNMVKLTERQKSGSEYCKTLAAFVRWVAPQRETLRNWSRKRRDQLRDALLERVPHARTATLGASLFVGLELFLRFAHEVGAITAEEKGSLERRGIKAFLHVLARQGDHQAASDPASLFVQLVGASLQSGDAHLLDFKTGGAPADDATARASGWRRSEGIGGSGGAGEWRPGGPCIGWIDPDNDALYLNPIPVYRAAQRQSETSPSRIAISDKTLWKRLKEANLLVRTDRERNTVKVRFGRRTLNLLHLSAAHVLGESGTSGTEPVSAGEGAPNREMFPIFVPDPASQAEGTGTGNGNTTLASPEADGFGAPVPNVPDPAAPRDGRLFPEAKSVSWSTQNA